jgi:hypothetical protein
MKKAFFVLSILMSVCSNLLLTAQPISVNNIVTTGRFNTCGIAPTITATFVSGNGSAVENGEIRCINPLDSTVIDLSVSVSWNKAPNDNWLHGVFFPNNTTGLRIIDNSLAPPSWLFTSAGCTGGCPSGAQFVGGPGYYFDGTAQSSCCNFGSGIDGNPCNNYGDRIVSCTVPFIVSFRMKIKNSIIRNNTVFRLYGTADGNTGCWNIADSTFNSIKFEFKGIKCNTNPLLCNPIGTTILTSDFSGSLQWQNSTDSIQFNNIANNTNYAGTTSASLTLSGINSSRYGEQFRCVANGINGQTFTLTFKNTWTGAVNSDWGTAGNWSCGTVPDAYTDVIINSGSIVVLNNSTTIRSLTLRGTASVTTATGVVLTILH